jgi:hypothetical protein
MLPCWLLIRGTSAASCGWTKLLHPSSSYLDRLQTSKLTHVQINIQVHKKSIGECSEMRSCTILSSQEKLYLDVDRQGPAVLRHRRWAFRCHALAMSRDSLPSGDPTKTPTVCCSSPAAATYISSTPPITQRLHLLRSIPSSKPQQAPRAPLPAASVGKLRQAHSAGKHPPSTRPAGKLQHARAPCA